MRYERKKSSLRLRLSRSDPIFLTPAPPSSRVLVQSLHNSHHKIIDSSTLRPSRHLWTTPVKMSQIELSASELSSWKLWRWTKNISPKFFSWKLFFTLHICILKLTWQDENWRNATFPFLKPKFFLKLIMFKINQTTHFCLYQKGW